jgi:putative ABC transport system substrate-binding protein
VVFDRVMVKLAAITLAVVVALGLCASPFVARAQQAGQVYRVGYLRLGSPGGDPFQSVFEQALRERGWVNGENLIIMNRYAEGQYDRLPALAADLVRLEPHVIVTVTTASVRAAKAATSTIPIVMWGVGDPIGAGLIVSFARPGNNVTGFTDVSPETYDKQLQLLKEAVPSARRMAVLSNPANPSWLPVLTSLKVAAASLGVQLQVFGARAPQEFEPAFQAMTQAQTDGLVVFDDASFFRDLDRLATLALRHRLPSICGNWNFAKAGGLMNYSVNRAETVRQVAGYVDKLLRGADPAELPVVQPTTFQTVINLKTARALALTIPQSLLLRTDEVIQ